jgi:hypothetical protein
MLGPEQLKPKDLVVGAAPPGTSSGGSGHGIRAVSDISWVTDWPGRCTMNAIDTTWD